MTTTTLRTTLSEVERDPAPLPSVGPLIDFELSRAWVAANYSDESKRLVTEGAEPLADDAARFDAAYRSGLFSVQQ